MGLSHPIYCPEFFIGNGQKGHLFKGCKQTKCPFFRKCAIKNVPMPPMSRIDPAFGWILGLNKARNNEKVAHKCYLAII